MSSYQNAQDMITLRLGVADNTLPSHVMPHYTTPECVMVCKCVSCLPPKFVVMARKPMFLCSWMDKP